MNTNLTVKKTLGAACIVAAFALTSACGGGGDDRPSKDEIVKGITKGSDGAISDKQAECAAKVIVDSDLSDEAVQALADGDADYKASDKDQKQQVKLVEKLSSCLK